MKERENEPSIQRKSLFVQEIWGNKAIFTTELSSSFILQPQLKELLREPADDIRPILGYTNIMVATRGCWGTVLGLPGSGTDSRESGCRNVGHVAAWRVLTWVREKALPIPSTGGNSRTTVPSQFNCKTSGGHLLRADYAKASEEGQCGLRGGQP